METIVHPFLVESDNKQKKDIFPIFCTLYVHKYRILENNLKGIFKPISRKLYEFLLKKGLCQIAFEFTGKTTFT